MKLIDVSVHQGNIDFKKVKAAGIDGVIIRAGYGQNNIDKRFKENIKHALAAGLPVGIYWFSYAYTTEMARKEAEYCLKAIKGYEITLPVFFDWEYDSMSYAKKNGAKPTKDLITFMYLTFCQAVKAAGYKAGYYDNPDYLRNHVNADKLTGFYFWLAHYTSKRTISCDIWQYSDKGNVNGISGNVDMNELINTKLLTKQEKPKQTQENKAQEKPKKTTSTTTIYIVKKGDTLSEIAKKYGTTVKKLAECNNIKDVNKIYVGQKLYV